MFGKKVSAEDFAKMAKAIETLQCSVDDIKKLPMTLVRWIGALIVSATVASMVQNVLQHRESVKQAEAATAAASTSAAASKVVAQKLSDLSDEPRSHPN